MRHHERHGHACGSIHQRPAAPRRAAPRILAGFIIVAGSIIVAGGSQSDWPAVAPWLVAGAVFMNLGWRDWWRRVNTGDWGPPAAHANTASWAIPAQLLPHLEPDRSARGQLRRAAPRLLYIAAVAALGLAIPEDSSLFVVWILLVFGVGLGPAGGHEWWRWVRTGDRRPPVPGGWLERGDLDVVIETADKRQHGSAVIAISKIIGIDLMDAQRLIDRAPSTVVEGVSSDSAERARDMLESAGATVSIRPTGTLADPAGQPA